MIIFNFVNFENLFHTELYSLPILNKIQNINKTIKAVKTTKLNIVM